VTKKNRFQSFKKNAAHLGRRGPQLNRTGKKSNHKGKERDIRESPAGLRGFLKGGKRVTVMAVRRSGKSEEGAHLF